MHYLPSQHTLRDYAHHVHSTTGFSTDVDKQLMGAAKVAKAEEWEKCVILVMHKMHVQEVLVYDKHSGALIGFDKPISTCSSSSRLLKGIHKQ